MTDIQALFSERFTEFLGLALTLLSGWAINQLRVWLKVKSDAESVEAKARILDRVAEEAINVAEEWAHNEKKVGKTIAGPEKLSIATRHITEQMTVGDAKAEHAIHAKLNQRRSISPLKGN